MSGLGTQESRNLKETVWRYWRNTDYREQMGPILQPVVKSLQQISCVFIVLI
mgnify:CR=1 FL=1